MTLDEAINHAEEVAEEQVKLCKRYDDASGYSRSHNETIRVADAKKCEKCAEEHRQLAEWLKDYKRLLEQQPCEDCVSRKRLMDNYNGVETPVGYRKVVDLEVIKNMSSVTPAFNWIPVSERLPRQNEYVGNVCKYYLIQDEFGDMQVATYTNNGWEPINTTDVLEADVVAWCSLPEPYRSESEE